MKKLKKRLERKLVCEVKVRICLQASLEYPVLIPSAIKLPICRNNNKNKIYLKYERTINVVMMMMMMMITWARKSIMRGKPITM